jgi:predicted permease
MANLWNDVKHALHMFIKNPGFTFAAVAALALGIGANTAIFTVVNAVLLKPLSYPNADRIVELELAGPNGTGAIASIPKFHIWQRQTSVFQEVAAYDFAGPGFNITGDRPEQIHGLHVSEGYFRLFGAPVLLGRTFTPQEDAPNGGHVVVLSYGLWQRKFGGNPNLVGQSLSLGNQAYTIIGVLGKEFLSDPDADIWVPFQFEPNSTNRGHYFQAAAMLKPGVTLAQANAQMKLAASEFLRAYPDADPQQSFAAEPLRDSIVGDARKSLFILLGAVGLVLLIACANVANLLLVRATGRKLVVWHGMRLALVGVALGIGAAFGLSRLISSFLFGVKSWDPAVFVSVPVILSAVALLAVWLPATRAAKLDPMQALRVE